LHLVNVWAAEARLVIGQRLAPGRNEVLGGQEALPLRRRYGSAAHSLRRGQVSAAHRKGQSVALVCVDSQRVSTALRDIALHCGLVKIRIIIHDQPSMEVNKVLVYFAPARRLRREHMAAGDLLCGPRFHKRECAFGVQLSIDGVLGLAFQPFIGLWVLRATGEE